MTSEEKAFIEISRGLRPGLKLDRLADVADKVLEKHGVQKTLKPFLLHMFDQFEIKGKYMDVPATAILKVIDALPVDWQKQMVSDLVLTRRIPSGEWHSYRSDSWLATHAATATANMEVEVESEAEGSPRIDYVVNLKCDLSPIVEQLKESMKGESEEDIESAIEDIRGEDFVSELDGILHEKLRRLPGIEGAGLMEIDNWPSPGNYKDAHIQLKVQVLLESREFEEAVGRVIQDYFKSLLD